MTEPQQVAAFEAVYRAEHRRLLRYLGRRVGLDDAPDLAQEAFLRLYGSARLAHIDNPQAYLTRIASNLATDRTRRQMRKPTWPLDEAHGAPAPPMQAARIEAMDVLRFYRQTVRAMPSKTRRVFVMQRMRRMTYKEVAAELGVCVQTVEHHMSRALVLCRAAVAAQW